MRKTEHFIVFFCLFWTFAGQAVETRPTRPSQLDSTRTQIAWYLEGAEVAWADYDLLRADYPDLAALSDEELEKWAASEAAVSTFLQSSLEGILVSKIPHSERTTRIYHPSTYLRAGLIQARVPGNENKKILLDLKGTGYGPEGEDRLANLVWMTGELRDLMTGPRLREKDLDRYRQTISTLEKQISGRQVQLKRSDLSAEQRRDIEHDLEDDQLKLKTYTLFFEAKKAVEADPHSRQSWYENFLSQIRQRDYLNGVAAADRLVKEAIIERAIHTLFQEYNAKHGTGFQTVRSYFVLSLPYDILLPDGRKRRAGIIGRQPHWRQNSRAGRKDFPPPPKEIIGSVLQGADQFDIFGRMVDFEIPEVTDPRVSSVLGWTDEDGQKIEELSRRAMKAFRLDGSAVFRLVEEVLSPLPKPPLSRTAPPTSRRDRFLDLWNQVQPDQIRTLTREGFLVRMHSLAQPNISDRQIHALLSVVILARPEWVADFLIQRSTVDRTKLTIEEIRYGDYILVPTLKSLYFDSRESAKQGARVIEFLAKQDASFAVNVLELLVPDGLRFGMAANRIGVLGGYLYFPNLVALISTAAIANLPAAALPPSRLTDKDFAKDQDGVECSMVDCGTDTVQHFTDHLRPHTARIILQLIEVYSGRPLSPELSAVLPEFVQMRAQLETPVPLTEEQKSEFEKCRQALLEEGIELPPAE